MREAEIAVEGVSFGYEKGRKILKELSFQASGTENIGLIGENGVGKSTLLKLLVGLYPEFTGTIRIGGMPVEKKNLAKIRSQIGYVFQDSDSQLFCASVDEDVAFAPRNYGLPEAEVERRVERALAMTGTLHLRDRKNYSLSGGEKKLVAIAGILSMSPDILLMDEPSAALDPKNRRRLIGILHELPQLKIIASHDMDLILDTCSRTLLMADGRIVRDGATEEILRDGELLEAHGLELPLRLQGQIEIMSGKMRTDIL